MHKRVCFPLFAFLLISNAAFAISVERKIFPEEYQNYQDIVVTLTIKREGVNSFAKVVEELPEGFKAKVTQAKGGKVMSEKGKLRIVWLSLPSQNSFQVTYKLENLTEKVGKFSIVGKFNYIEDDQRIQVDIDKSYFSVTEALAQNDEEKAGKDAVNEQEAAPAEPSAMPQQKEVPQSNNTANADFVAQKGVVYKVQLGAFSKEKPTRIFKGLKDVHHQIDNGLYKYYSGNFTNEEEARKNITKAKEAGFPGAFLVIFKDGVRQ